MTVTFPCSDQMGNKGAFITMGPDMKPNFTIYDAVVSSIFFYVPRITSSENY